MFKRLAIFALFFGALTAPAQTIYVDSYRYAAGTTYLLDEYPGAAAAYSLRVLAAAFENSDLVEVRRSSDDATSGFTAAEITDGTLTTWVGAGNDGFVVTWYDQSGNGDDATQSLSSSQPKIVSSGSIITLDGTNPAIQPDGSNDFFNTSAISGSTVYQFGVFYRTAAVRTIFAGASINENRSYGFMWWSNNQVYVSFDDTAQTSLVTDTSEGPHIGTGYRISGECGAYLNGSLVGTTSEHTASNYQTALLLRRSADHSQSPVSEIIIYPSDQSSNRTGIESNINAHYSIY
jgi:hypothetical protein